jgi:hypothetical protein
MGHGASTAAAHLGRAAVAGQSRSPRRSELTCNIRLFRLPTYAAVPLSACRFKLLIVIAGWTRRIKCSTFNVCWIIRIWKDTVRVLCTVYDVVASPKPLVELLFVLGLLRRTLCDA